MDRALIGAYSCRIMLKLYALINKKSLELFESRTVGGLSHALGKGASAMEIML